MLVIDIANAAQAFNRGLVIQVANQGIAGIGWQRHNAAAVNDLRRLLDQSQLRSVGMNLKELAHKEERRLSEDDRRCGWLLLFVVINACRAMQRYAFRSVDGMKTMLPILMRRH